MANSFHLMKDNGSHKKIGGPSWSSSPAYRTLLQEKIFFNQFHVPHRNQDPTIIQVNTWPHLFCEGVGIVSPLFFVIDLKLKATYH